MPGDGQSSRDSLLVLFPDANTQLHLDRENRLQLSSNQPACQSRPRLPTIPRSRPIVCTDGATAHPDPNSRANAKVLINDHNTMMCHKAYTLPNPSLITLSRLRTWQLLPLVTHYA
jgi:hypothetical protein